MSRIELDLQTMRRSTSVWTVVVEQFPNYRKVAVVSSATTRPEDDWAAVDLPPGRYTLGLRYYPSDDAEGAVCFPAVRIDGHAAAPARPLRDDPADLYRALPRITGAWQAWLQYYAYTLLLYKHRLPTRWVEREFGPVANPETRFYYDVIRRGEQLSLQLAPELLAQYNVYVCLSGRDSLPRHWELADTPTYLSPPASVDGFYIVRVHRNGQRGGGSQVRRPAFQVRWLDLAVHDSWATSSAGREAMARGRDAPSRE